MDHATEWNLYSEAIFQEALEERNVGVKVNGVWVNNIRYEDDTVLIADNMEDLRDMLGTVGKCSKNIGFSRRLNS